MIRIRKKATIPIPAILLSKGKAAIAVLIQRYDAGERNFESTDFDKKIYGHGEVKRALAETQNGKCCFCESKIQHISPGDVEHFRPKSGWIQNDEKLNKPGYYWLAYEWDNLLLSCQLCNQRHKKNFFPLLHGSPRALSHNDNAGNEQPLFVHPANEEVETFITFSEEIPKAVDSNERGKETISKLGLDREQLNEQRRTTLNRIRTIYDLAKLFPAFPPELKEKAVNMVRQCQAESTQDDTEYASMLRSFFRDNPVNF
ncbi:MAG: hypothetical protein J7621_11325 [Niastella sp.]|nr:hypothetical protein [Niastella sp.]